MNLLEYFECQIQNFGESICRFLVLFFKKFSNIPHYHTVWILRETPRYDLAIMIYERYFFCLESYQNQTNILLFLEIFFYFCRCRRSYQLNSAIPFHLKYTRTAIKHMIIEFQLYLHMFFRFILWPMKRKFDVDRQSTLIL